MLQNRTLGCTPYFLMFGTEGHMAHHLWHLKLRGEDLEEQDQKEIAHRLAGRMGMLYELVRRRALDQSDKSAEYYNKKHLYRQYEEGDKVWCLTFPTSSKVDHRTASHEPLYKGPYTVHRVRGPVTYDLEREGKLLERISVAHLRPWTGQEAPEVEPLECMINWTPGTQPAQNQEEPMEVDLQEQLPTQFSTTVPMVDGDRTEYQMGLRRSARLQHK
jgi:hypothetical protein